MNTTNDGGPAFPHGPLGDSIHGEDGLIRHQYHAHFHLLILLPFKII